MKIEDSISISELSEKCRALLIENSSLKEEIKALKARLVIVEARYSGDEISGKKSESEIIAPQAAEVSPPGMSKNADEGEKIKLFMSLFKGRDDVYARRTAFIILVWRGSTSGNIPPGSLFLNLRSIYHNL